MNIVDKDGFTTRTHLSMLNRSEEEELKDKVFAALDFIKYCPSEKGKEEKIYKSYNVTEADVKKYQKEWENIFGKL